MMMQVFTMIMLLVGGWGLMRRATRLQKEEAMGEEMTSLVAGIVMWGLVGIWAVAKVIMMLQLEALSLGLNWN